VMVYYQWWSWWCEPIPWRHHGRRWWSRSWTRWDTDGGLVLLRGS
jgi:hypothetical protein